MKHIVYFFALIISISMGCSSNPEPAQTTHTHADGTVHANHDCTDQSHHHHAVPEGQESFIILDDGSISLTDQPHEHHHDCDHEHKHEHGPDGNHDHDHDHTHGPDCDHNHDHDHAHSPDGNHTH